MRKKFFYAINLGRLKLKTDLFPILVLLIGVLFVSGLPILWGLKLINGYVALITSIIIFIFLFTIKYLLIFNLNNEV